MITKAVDTGISYKVIPPNLTDAYITVGTSNNNLRKVLMDNGIDAILKTEITQVYYDEYISQETDWVSSKDKAGRPYNKKRFYLVQQYAISLSYTLTDVENNKIIATSTFASDTREKKTQIGHTEDATDRFYEDYYTITSASQLLRNLIKEFTDSFRAELSPHYVTEYFTFFPNKPKEKSLESAYDALTTRSGTSLSECSPMNMQGQATTMPDSTPPSCTLQTERLTRHSTSHRRSTRRQAVPTHWICTTTSRRSPTVRTPPTSRSTARKNPEQQLPIPAV
jgi:hypothetical protein